MAGRKKGHNVITVDGIESFIAQLFAESKLEIQGFGTFTIKKMKARRGFNPGTGEYDNFPSYNKISFEPSPIFRQRLQLWIR